MQHRHKIAPEQHEALAGKMAKRHDTLGELPATAICGNDITSSCLYVAGIVASKAGQLAPFALILVAVVLYIFRKACTPSAAAAAPYRLTRPACSNRSTQRL